MTVDAAITGGPAETDHASRTRLVWVTNIPTPYRLDLWAVLRQRVDLSVLCMAASEPNRRWDGDALLRTGDAHDLKARAVRLGQDIRVYLPTRALRKRAGRGGATVLIDGWESPAYFSAMRAARRSGNPVVLSYRSAADSQRFTRGPVDWQRRAMFGRADCVLTGGVATSRVVAGMGVRKDHVVEGINAVDVAGLARSASALRSASKAGHRYIVVGQLIGRKNVGSVISAFQKIREPEDALTIVGTGSCEGNLKRQIARSGLGDCVRMTGELHGLDMVAEYAKADTLVLASTREVYGLVVLEALACGAHAVVSIAAGVAGSAEGMSGVFVASPTVEGMAGAMTASRAAWTGPIEDPAALKMTIDEAANRAVLAVATATRNAHRAAGAGGR